VAVIPNLRKIEEAVKSVNSMIGSIKKSTEFIDAESPGTYFHISFSVPVPGDYSDEFSSTMVCNNKDTLHPMVLNYQKDLAKQIRKLVKEFGLELAADEECIISQVEAKTYKDVSCRIK